MFLFVKIDSACNFTRGLLYSRHSRLVVAESDLEFIECGTNILNFTFITSVWINYIFRFTVNMLSNI